MVAGYSLGGFETSLSTTTIPGNEGSNGEDDDAWLRRLQYPLTDGRREAGKMYGLQEQIGLCYGRIDALVKQSRGDPAEARSGVGEKGASEAGTTNIILMGHSVGSYIALEVIRMWKERYSDAADDICNAGAVSWRPTAAFLLTPTIIDIHKSSSGTLASPLLSTVPVLPQLAQLATTALRYSLPASWLSAVVGKVTGMTSTSGLLPTLAFLNSPSGVNQALHLARDELATIRDDKWSKEIWEACPPRRQQQDDYTTSSPHLQSKTNRAASFELFFLFAQRDHWVADETREAIRETYRGDQRRFVVERSKGLVHAWCLSQNSMVAELMSTWLAEVFDGGKGGSGGEVSVRAPSV